MRVYHGSYTAVEKPEIREGKFPKDFGEGFYCTKLEEQASRWAMRYDTAVVSVYGYLPDETLNMLVFPEMTGQWLDFILNCRSGKKHDFDIVSGAMVNDQIYNYIADYIAGVITREQFWVLAKFKYPTHQICFCSEKALNTLQFIDNKKIK
jgi:hypothetical protein